MLVEAAIGAGEEPEELLYTLALVAPRTAVRILKREEIGGRPLPAGLSGRIRARLLNHPLAPVRQAAFAAWAGRPPATEEP